MLIIGNKLCEFPDLAWVLTLNSTPSFESEDSCESLICETVVMTTDLLHWACGTRGANKYAS